MEEYLKMLENMDEEMPSGINDSPHPSSPSGESTFPQGKAFEEAKHRAEVFERMAFKLSEELEAAKGYIKGAPIFPPCGACLYKDEDSNGKHCKNCTGRNSHFIFSAEKAREEE